MTKNIIRIDRTHRAVSAGLSALLALALMGSVPSAYAEEDSSTPDDFEQEEVEEVEEGEESAFKLGNVQIECLRTGAATGAFTVGVAQTHAYDINNLGEPAYVRFASRLVCGILVQETTSVVEVASRLPDPEEERATTSVARTSEDPDATEGEEETREEEEPPNWYLAPDGWWYRNIPLKVGESVTLNMQAIIPDTSTWVSVMNSGKPTAVESLAYAEAVQARNMIVDREGESPWGDIEVEGSGEPATESTETVNLASLEPHDIPQKLQNEPDVAVVKDAPEMPKETKEPFNAVKETVEEGVSKRETSAPDGDEPITDEDPPMLDDEAPDSSDETPSPSPESALSKDEDKVDGASKDEGANEE